VKTAFENLKSLLYNFFVMNLLIKNSRIIELFDQKNANKKIHRQKGHIHTFLFFYSKNNL
jgi:hypothetical protein